jgi:hypothetical protein
MQEEQRGASLKLIAPSSEDAKTDMGIMTTYMLEHAAAVRSAAVAA